MSRHANCWVACDWCQLRTLWYPTDGVATCAAKKAGWGLRVVRKGKRVDVCPTCRAKRGDAQG